MVKYGQPKHIENNDQATILALIVFLLQASSCDKEEKEFVEVLLGMPVTITPPHDKCKSMITRASTMLFLLISCIASGQEQLWVVKVSPLALLSPNYPALHVGLEFKSSYHWSFSADYGFKTPDILFHWNSSKINIRQYKYRAEVRYYLGHYFNRTYLASEVHFIAKSYIRTDDWYSNPYGYFAFTSANVKTKEFGAVLKVGYNRDVKVGYNKDVVKNLLLDIFIGLGPRWLQVKYFPADANPVPFPGGLEDWIVPIDRSEGTFLKLYFIVGLKLGYIISRK